MVNVNIIKVEEGLKFFGSNMPGEKLNEIRKGFPSGKMAVIFAATMPNFGQIPLPLLLDAEEAAEMSMDELEEALYEEA